jgi:hypothetical protein
MAGTQVPKGLGIAMLIVGIPIILWNAVGVSQQLDEAKAASNSVEGRIERCMALGAEELPDESIRHAVCGCVVEKASASGANRDYGAYDEDLLMPIFGECYRGDRD